MIRSYHLTDNFTHCFTCCWIDWDLMIFQICMFNLCLKRLKPYITIKQYNRYCTIYVVIVHSLCDLVIKLFHYNDINIKFYRTSVLFVSISFIVLMVISLAWLVFYYIQRFRYIHAKDQLSVSHLSV